MEGFEIIIYRLIRDSDKISYNDLRRKLVDTGQISFHAFDRCMQRLEKSERIVSYGDETHSQKKLYSTPRKTRFKDADSDAHDLAFLKMFENQLTFVKTIYRRLPLERKIELMISMCHTLQSSRIYSEAGNLATFGKTVMTITHREIRERHDELFSMIYDMINSDIDNGIILDILQTDPLYRYVPDPTKVDDALELCFKNIEDDRKNDDMLLVLKDADGKPLEPLSKKELEDFKKGVKNREALAVEDLTKDVDKLVTQIEELVSLVEEVTEDKDKNKTDKD